MAFTFGVAKPCTPAQLHKETKELYAKSTLAEVGTFYFTFGKRIDSVVREVFLKFYDAENQVLHTSCERVTSDLGTAKIKIQALDCFMFLFHLPHDTLFLVMKDDWSKGAFHLCGSVRKALQDTRAKETRLSKIRLGTPGDITLVSSDGMKIKVHSAVLIPQWSYLASRPRAELDMQCPSATLEMIVCFFYQQGFLMTKRSAFELIRVAEIYGLPELLDEVIEYFQSNRMSAVDALSAWQRSGDEKLQKCFAAMLKPIMSENLAGLRRLSHEDMGKLLHDMSEEGHGNKRRRVASK